MNLRKCACIETLYTELPFLSRFRAAAEDGFDAVEFWSWTDKDLSAVKAAARTYREAHPDVRHPRVAVLSDGSASRAPVAVVAVWTKKHPVTERGEVSRF